ncbi:ejaculatory bulb-specific protein 3-like [Bicyclus anynana]|uniref:Ejaculatory bulb-specific protein 3-like n=1 Tax=Bicyclus anynana TaxID=110368 RepID=A0A6J1NBX9_BICAN|nr:ejaculatory bulb-specific protein 3-like [Bicyclus anynana]
MKWVIVLSALMVLAAAKELYSTENDDFDIDSADSETLKAFLNCFNDKGACDERSTDFKNDIPEAVVQACAKCTPEQKHIFKVFLESIKVQDPEGYKVFQQKYDPQNKYIAALQAAIANA